MPSANQFNSYAGELQTSISTFPVRLTFGQSQITPLMADFDFKLDGKFSSQYFIQGGPGAALYLPNVRSLQGSLSLPVRVTEGKELESVASKLIDYVFFDNSELPQVPLYFTAETGYYKTASGWLVPPGETNFDFNDAMIQIKADRCLIESLKMATQNGSPLQMSVVFKGTVNKDPRRGRHTSTSAQAAVKSSFDVNRVLGYQDSRFMVNGSYVPNVTGISVDISRKISEQRFTKSVDASIGIGPVYPVVDLLQYSLDLPSKVGVSEFEISVTVDQALRRIDEDIYLSRGGTAEHLYSGENFIEVWLGPIKIARRCAVVQISEQPWKLGVVTRSTTFLLLSKPRVFKGDFISIATGGGW